MPVVQVGETFGRLTVAENTRTGPYAACLCRCECGTEKVIRRDCLTDGVTKSYGCLQRDSMSRRQRRHGMSASPTWRVWRSMRQRCEDSNCKGFAGYGGRGIRVCERWQVFENFIDDMGEAPKGMQLERIDNDGNYEPSNCKWATRKEQARNRRSTKFVEYRGERMCVSELADKVGMSRGTLACRLKRGVPVEQAVRNT